MFCAECGTGTIFFPEKDRTQSDERLKFQTMPRAPRRGGGVTVRNPPALVTLHDVARVGDEDGEETAASAEELLEHFYALAAANRWPAGALLANSSIQAGKRLRCRLVRRLPDHTCWMFHSSGYIVAKMRRTPVVAGRSYTRAAVADPVYRGAPTTHTQPSAPTQVSPESPPRPKRASRSLEERFPEFTTSPDTPGGAAKGCTQPTLIAWHKVAALAACNGPSARKAHVIRHICGNRECAVLSHFRPGSTRANDLDRDYHRSHRGCSRESFPPLQEHDSTAP